MNSKYDLIIIGAGPNGLTAGAYLSKAGLKVLLIERRTEIGGGLCTEEVTLPGFYHNTHSIYHMMVDYMPPYMDLELENRYDVKYVYPDVQIVMLLSNGREIILYKDMERSYESIKSLSKKDADTYKDIYYKYKNYMEDFLVPATYYPPSPPLDQLVELQKSNIGREIIDISEKSPKEIIDELFENEGVKALMLYLSCLWGLDYDTQGLGYLVPLFINRATNYRLCIGGSHRLSNALSKIVYENKGTILTSERIKRIIIDNGTAKGVEMEDGRIILSKMGIVSSINPNQTFLELVGEKYLDKEFIEKIKGWKWEKWSLFGIHMAIDGIPKFKSSYPEIGNALLYIIGYDNPDDIIRHWNSIENGNLMDRGGFNLSFPSLHDPTQAPNGKNTGVISQFAPYLGDIWYKIREEHAERCIDLLKEYIDINILFKYPVTPLDIENKFADMKYGSIKQGAYTPFQMGFFRPNEESSQTITPVKNLYLAGASCHPGGMITLGPGYLAANAILSELGVERWWKEPEYIKKAKEKGVLL